MSAPYDQSHLTGRQATYKYDAFGRRIKKTVTDKSGKPTTTEFLWQGDNLIAETDNKEHYQSYIYEPNSFKPLALIVGRGKEHKVYHYQLDHIGTPLDLTNREGKAVWSAQYLAYGTIYTQHTEEVTNPLRFQGQYFDQETGLHYNRHRYYNPKNGLFTTADPIGLAGGLNNYQYVKNPTGFVDPLGLADVPMVGGGCGGKRESGSSDDAQPEIQSVEDGPEVPKGVKQKYRELADQAIAKTRTNANPTVTRNGKDIFRVHKADSGHRYKVTQQIMEGPSGNRVFPNAKDVNVRSSHIRKLQKALNREGGYELRLRNGRIVE